MSEPWSAALSSFYLVGTRAWIALTGGCSCAERIIPWNGHALPLTKHGCLGACIPTTWNSSRITLDGKLIGATILKVVIKHATRRRYFLKPPCGSGNFSLRHWHDAACNSKFVCTASSLRTFPAHFDSGALRKRCHVHRRSGSCFGVTRNVRYGTHCCWGSRIILDGDSLKYVDK